MNERLRIGAVQTVGHGHGTLRRTTFSWRRNDGNWQEMVRESYGRGNGAAVLPIDPSRGTVILIRQFRFAVHEIHPDGMLIETIAGLLDELAPEAAIRKEAEEEAGLVLTDVAHAFDMYPSPGVVTERIACFTATYTRDGRRSEGGGLHQEGEDIETLELPFETALGMIRTAEIQDAKTTMLLQHARLAGLA